MEDGICVIIWGHWRGSAGGLKRKSGTRGKLCLRITIPGIPDYSLLIWNKHQRRSNFSKAESEILR